uniref:Uncharacterized protein n=1 Tax=Tanacetum cinerariifolium TaxID=118510 RepID=A0A6L2MSH4_TANCI|nr:hypothetical protein [Tanacetum cinerariifolium]
MDAPLSLDHAFDFFADEPVPGLAEAPKNQNRWIEWDVPLGGEMDEPMENPGFDKKEELDDFIDDDEDVHVMASQAVQVVSRLEEIKARVQQVERIVDTHPSGQMAMLGQDMIVGLSQQVQTLQMALHGAEL